MVTVSAEKQEGWAKFAPPFHCACQKLIFSSDSADDRAAALAAGHRGLVTWRSLFLHPGCTATWHKAHVVHMCVCMCRAAAVFSTEDMKLWMLCMHAMMQMCTANIRLHSCTKMFVHTFCMYTCTSVLTLARPGHFS